MQNTSAAMIVAPIKPQIPHLKKGRPVEIRRSATATLILMNMAPTA